METKNNDNSDIFRILFIEQNNHILDKSSLKENDLLFVDLYDRIIVGIYKNNYLNHIIQDGFLARAVEIVDEQTHEFSKQIKSIGRITTFNDRDFNTEGDLPSWGVKTILKVRNSFKNYLNSIDGINLTSVGYKDLDKNEYLVSTREEGMLHLHSKNMLFSFDGKEEDFIIDMSNALSDEKKLSKNRTCSIIRRISIPLELKPLDNLLQIKEGDIVVSGTEGKVIIGKISKNNKVDFRFDEFYDSSYQESFSLNLKYPIYILPEENSIYNNIDELILSCNHFDINEVKVNAGEDISDLLLVKRIGNVFVIEKGPTKTATTSVIKAVFWKEIKTEND